MTNYQERFNKAIKTLNEAQREAVETTEGPVLVIAGPGTGKTQILASRIGCILSQTDSLPENILCLTYTEAGAIAMRKRLMELIGPDAYRVTVSTFHAFCNNVIQDNLDLFGIRTLEPISELELVELFHDLIDTFENNHPLKRWSGDIYFETKRLRNLYHVMKSEGWSPEFVKQRIRDYIDGLPENPKYIYQRNTVHGKKGSLKQSLFDSEVEKMKKLEAAALEYPRFQMMMQERGRYDYDDMILWVLQKFVKSPELLLNYQEQYHYFLVDEFQDTNGVQNEILQQLTSYWEAPNVFVVGDDDQSIFRFQGANVANIMEFYERYKSQVKLIILIDNYRSSQKILDVSMKLISNNQDRLIRNLKELKLNKDLRACNEVVAASTVNPAVVQYFNSIHEEADIAEKIQELYRSGQDLSEVAVLYLKHAQATDLSTFLERKNIPVNIKRNANVLETITVQQILKILQYIAGEIRQPFSREDLLFEIMHFSFTGINPLEIARLVYNLRSSGERQIKFIRESIVTIPAKTDQNLFTPHENSNPDPMLKFGSQLETWISQANNLTLQNLVEKIITGSGMLGLIMNDPDRTWKMQELSTFFDFIKSESAKIPNIRIPHLLERIRLMELDNIPLPISKTAYSENGVNFITTHSAKGLEFKYVFLMGCNKEVWEKKLGSRNNYSLPDNLIQAPNGDDSEERRRLFYVALTRAKEVLQISFPNANHLMKPLEMSKYVAEVVGGSDIEVVEKSVSEDQFAEYQLTLMKDIERRNIPLLDEPSLRKALENYSMSVTHLNKFIKCPLLFYFESLLRVPQSKNAAMEFGSAIHFALEQFFKRMLENESVFPDKKELIRYFETHMKRHSDSFTNKEFEQKTAYGKEILPLYHDHYISEWNRKVSVEENVKGVEVSGVPINGKLDKVEFIGNNANVVDYKTGSFEKSRQRKSFNRPGEKVNQDTPSYVAEYGGDYWRQAVFYKILLDNDRTRNWQVVSSEFDFIESDSKGVYQRQRVDIDEQDVELVKEQIRETYQKIMNLEFDKGCGEEHCRWCNFVRNNYLELAEPDMELEAG